MRLKSQAIVLFAIGLCLSLGCYGSPETHTTTTITTGGGPLIKFFAPAPLPPVQVVNVVPKNGSIDGTDFNARANTVYLLPKGTFTLSKQNQLKKDKIAIRSASTQPSEAATVYYQGTWGQQAFIVSGSGCSITGINIMGHDGAEFVHVHGAHDFEYQVDQLVSPTKGGIGPITTDSSTNLVFHDSNTERIARYGIFMGWSNGENVNWSVLRSKLGPCASIEDVKISKRPKSGLNGGGFSEHPLRAYGSNGGLIDSCDLENPHNPDGKNPLKLMNGKGVIVRNTTINGSGPTRCGRDVNDPKSYTLTDTNFFNCLFSEFVRVDPGAKIAMFNCDVAAKSGGQVFQMNGDGGLYVQDSTTTYSGKSGRFSNRMDRITVGQNVTFNGKPAK